MSGEPVTLVQFFDAWDLFALPALAGTLAGALLGFLGVYVVLGRMVFLSAALSQAAGLGVALACYARAVLGLPALLTHPMLGATGLTLAATFVLLGDRNAHGAGRDARLGLAYLLGTAGALALGTRLAQELGDLQSLLFGSAVVVSPGDFKLIAVIAAGLLGLHLWWRRGFVQAAFDRDGAAVRGLPVRLLEVLLLLSLALAISATTRVLGALPVFAFSVLPAMAAIPLSATPSRALVLASALGAAAGFLGYLAAFRWQLPVGPAQALVAAAFVAASLPLRRLRSRHA
jgi:zinc transport system permease protein